MLNRFRAAPANLIVTSCLTLFGAGLSQAAEGPFRINDSIDPNSGFRVGLIHSSRFEHIVDDVRPASSKNDHALIQRTLLDMRYRSGGFQAQLEIADMRQQLMDRDNRATNGWLNPLDVLQANLGYNFGPEGNTLVRFGRFTEDWGSRRLMARNRFRNAIGSWDGLVVHHRDDSGNSYRFMATQVVRRLPTDKESLLDNQRESDESSDAQRFYGAFAVLPDLLPNLTTELFFYALREKDTSDVRTRNRRLDTYGFRLISPSNAGAFDVEVETIFQSGKQRASTSPADLIDLDHQAFFQYLSVGYNFDVPSGARLSFEFDYSTGDENPFDRDSERFDSLFGPTTFEFGVVGLYDPFNRSNLITPGLQFSLNPVEDVSVSAFYRHFWLEESRDTWGRTGLRDVTGESGDYLGQHLEVRVRWDAVPGNVRIEGGGIYLSSDSLSSRNTEYLFLGVTFTI